VKSQRWLHGLAEKKECSSSASQAAGRGVLRRSFGGPVLRKGLDEEKRGSEVSVGGAVEVRGTFLGGS